MLWLVDVGELSLSLTTRLLGPLCSWRREHNNAEVQSAVRTRAVQRAKVRVMSQHFASWVQSCGCSQHCLPLFIWRHYPHCNQTNLIEDINLIRRPLINVVPTKTGDKYQLNLSVLGHSKISFFYKCAKGLRRNSHESGFSHSKCFSMSRQNIVSL